MLSLKRQLHVDSAVGFELDVRNEFDKNVRKALDLTGNPEFKELYDNAYPRSEKNLKLREILTQAHADYPEIETYDMIRERLRDEAQELIDLQVRTADRASFWGVAGEFAGGTAGSLDPRRDPLYALGVLTGPGAARTLLGRIAMEALIGASFETLQQGMFVEPRYKELNLKENQPLMNILFGAGGGAVFGALFHTAGRFYSRIKENRELARGIDTIKAELEKRRGEPFVETRQSPQELADLAEVALPESGEKRIVVEALRRQAREEALSPLDTSTREGRLDTDTEVTKASAELVGAEVPPRVERRHKALELVRQSEPDILARERKPRVYEKLDEAKAARDAIVEELVTLQKAVKEAEKKAPKDVPPQPKRAAQLAGKSPKTRLNKLKKELAAAEEAGASEGTIKRYKGQIAQEERRIREAREGVKAPTIDELEARIKELGLKLQDVKNEQAQKGIAIRLKEAKEQHAAMTALDELRPKLEAQRARSKEAQDAVEGLEGDVRAIRKRAKADIDRALKAVESATIRGGDGTADVQALSEQYAARQLDPEKAEDYLGRLEVDEDGQIDLGLDETIDAKGARILTEDGMKRVEDVLEEIKEDKALLQNITTCSFGGKKE